MRDGSIRTIFCSITNASIAIAFTCSLMCNFSQSNFSCCLIYPRQLVHLMPSSRGSRSTKLLSLHQSNLALLEALRPVPQPKLQAGRTFEKSCKAFFTILTWRLKIRWFNTMLKKGLIVAQYHSSRMLMMSTTILPSLLLMNPCQSCKIEVAVVAPLQLVLVLRLQ